LVSNGLIPFTPSYSSLKRIPSKPSVERIALQSPFYGDSIQSRGGRDSIQLQFKEDSIHPIYNNIPLNLVSIGLYPIRVQRTLQFRF
jgi:hypothetical protein